MNDLASAAFRLALRGLWVFPLSPRSKVPLAGSSGCRGASNDLELVRIRWQQNQQANIAIATGKRSRLWVLDVDGEKGLEALCDLEVAYGKLPITVTVTTPGGGLHLYWKWTRDLRNSAGRVGRHIDVRGEGGSIVAPPSIHPNGGCYRWIKNGAKGFAVAPDWLIDLALPPPPPKIDIKPLTGVPTSYVTAAVASELTELGQASNGTRNHTLNKVAFKLAGFVKAGSLPEDWARAQLEARARALGLPACEAKGTIASAFGAAEPRELPR